MPATMFGLMTRRRIASVIDGSFATLLVAVVVGTMWVLTSTHDTVASDYRERLEGIAASVAAAISSERSGFKEQLYRLGEQPLKPLRIAKPIRYFYETDACFDQSPV